MKPKNDGGKLLLWQGIIHTEVNMSISTFVTGVQLTNLKYSAHSYGEDSLPFIYATISLRGYWFRIDYRSLNGIKINGNKQRTKIIIEFPHDSPHPEERSIGYLGKVILYGYSLNDDTYDDKSLRVQLNMSLPMEMLNNIINLTDNKFIGFESSIEWGNYDSLLENIGSISGKIKEAHFIHEVTSMYDFTGKVPKEESDHFHYKV